MTEVMHRKSPLSCPFSTRSLAPTSATWNRATSRRRRPRVGHHRALHHQLAELNQRCARRPQYSTYLTLHRADCPHLGPRPGWSNLRDTYAEACGTSPAPFGEWLTATLDTPDPTAAPPAAADTLDERSLRLATREWSEPTSTWCSRSPALDAPAVVAERAGANVHLGEGVGPVLVNPGGSAFVTPATRRLTRGGFQAGQRLNW